MKKVRRKSKPDTGAKITVRTAMWLGVLIVALISLVAYWNSFDAPLVFDDFLSIQRNSGVRFGDSLRPSAIGGRSLLYVTFAINYALHEQEVWGYHLVSLIFHILNGVLILFLAKQIFQRTGIDESRAATFAIMAAVFFVAHPVQTESVTYISSRSELVSTFFYLVALLLFVKVPDHRVGFFLSLVIGAVMYMGLLSKETAISLPAVLVAYDFLFRSEGRFRGILSRWRFYATFLVGGTAAGYFLVTGPLRGAVGGSLPGHLSPWHYLLTQSRVILRYIQIVFVPAGLNLDYDFNPSTSPFEPAVLASVAVLAGLLVLAWRVRRSQKIVSFSILWFFFTLAPTSSFVPIRDVIFEHRLYLPMAGLCLLFPLGMEAGTSFLRNRTPLRLGPVPVSVALLLILTLGSARRNEVWRDEVRLWSDVVAKSPLKPRGHNALAMSHFRRGEYNQGLEVARNGLEAIPDRRNLFVDTIGNMYLQLGRYKEAAEVFRDAAETEAALGSPDRAFVGMEYNNLGVSYLWMWRLIRENEQNMTATDFESAKLRVLEPALDAFTKSLDWGSEMFSPLDSHVNVMSWLGRSEELRGEHSATLNEAEDFRSRYVLAKVAFNDNDFETAVTHFEQALDPDPGEPQIWFNLGYSLERLKRSEEAIEAYMQAIRLNPVFIEAHYNIGLRRMDKQEFGQAIANFEEILRLYPAHVLANIALAKIYLQTNEVSLARRHLATVLDASPNHPEALALWGRLGS